MLLPKNPKNPLNTIPFFTDVESPFPFQDYMFQVHCILAINQAKQVENVSRELLSWVLQEWFDAMLNSMTKPKRNATDKDTCTLEVSRELIEFSTRLLLEMKGAKRKNVELVPETRELSAELKANGLTPKSPVPKEDLNALKDSEIFDTSVPSKERKKKPTL